MSEILPIIREKHFFLLELREKVLENSTNSGKNYGKIKIQNYCEPCLCVKTKKIFVSCCFAVPGYLFQSRIVTSLLHHFHRRQCGWIDFFIWLIAQFCNQVPRIQNQQQYVDLNLHENNMATTWILILVTLSNLDFTWNLPHNS